MTTSFTRKLAAAGVAVAGAVGLVGINSAQSHAATPTLPAGFLNGVPSLNLPGLVAAKLNSKKLGIAQQVQGNANVAPVLSKIQNAINAAGLGGQLGIFTPPND